MSIKSKLSTIAAATLMAACLTLTATACSDDDGDNNVIDRPVKATLTLASYYDGSGAANQMKWAADMRAILCVAATGHTSSAMPIRPNQVSSLFLFKVQAPAVATVVSYYPPEAMVSVGEGKVGLEIPTRQDGTVSPLLIGSDRQPLSAYEGCNITLRQFASLLMVKIARGNYAVASIEVRGNAGEGIAGAVTIDADAWTVAAAEPAVTVTLPAPVDCSLAGTTVAAALAPVALAEGYTVTVNTTAGTSFTTTSTTPLTLESGAVHFTDDASDREPPHLVVGGSNKVHIVNVAKCMNADYSAGLTWTWDAATAASTLGIAASRCDHIDDCKPVDGASKLLITSSYNWCVLLDRTTKEVLFYTNQCGDAHSAELLPDGRLVVACSTGTGSTYNQVQLYDVAKPDKVLFSYPLNSAHGVVWCEANQRLYATGGNQLLAFSLQDWATASPSLRLEKSITTPQGGNHDLTLADANTLVVAGVKAYLFDVNSEAFTEMPLFAASTGLKSVNYNPLTDELWYTDATVPEGTQTWSTHTLRYATSPTASAMAGSINISDMDVYKVRVLNW